jgi:hypothetical protein
MIELVVKVVVKVYERMGRIVYITETVDDKDVYL